MWERIVEAWNTDLSLWGLVVLGMAITAISMVGVVIFEEAGKSLRTRIRNGLLLVLVFGLIWIGLWFLRPLLERPAYIWSSYQDNVIGYGVVLAVALYFLRRKRKEIYGAIEVLIALVALYVFSTVPVSAVSGIGLVAWVAGFAAPVYIMIRGFDNIEKGWRIRHFLRRRRSPT